MSTENLIIQTSDRFAYPAEVVEETAPGLLKLRVVTAAEIKLNDEAFVRRKGKKYATKIHNVEKIENYWQLRLTLLLEV